MQPSQKFVFDVGITFFASVINMLLGFFIQPSKSLNHLAECFDKIFLKSFSERVWDLGRRRNVNMLSFDEELVEGRHNIQSFIYCIT